MNTSISRRRLLGLGAAASVAATLPAAPAAAAPRYRWRNAVVVGGGFVPGIVFNQREPGLVYARTDIGGCYRLDPRSGTWIPLLDGVGWDEWGHTGVISLATDEVDPDRVYAAVGTYTIDAWDPANGAVLCSRDRGRTWRTSPLPFHLGGNMPGRGIGERLAVDPSRNSVLYLGVRGGFGLWRSTDFGCTWAEVTAFPNPGNVIADPNDTSGYSTDNAGVLQTVFDKRGTRRGQACKVIYVTVADVQNMLYRSTDAGRTWQRVEGQPTGFIPHKMVLDPAGGFLYLATGNTVGPYDGSKGDVWRLDTATGAWTNISPVPSTSDANAFGYSGLTIDRQHPGTLVVAAQIMWWPEVQMWRSTDGGATWTAATLPEGVTGPGVEDQAAAISADGARVVWAPAGSPVVCSTDGGQTWQACAGLAPGTPVRSDRVDPMRFYAFAAGTFYLSTDGAATFAATAATGLPAEGNARFKAVPGHRGDIWLAGGSASGAYGIWRSADSGASFTRLPGVDQGDVVGFGKAAPGRHYPAVFTSAKISRVRGIFRSDDAGHSWVRVNDIRHQYGWTGNTITGDPRVFGRVYVGTNGRGVIVGDRS